MEKLAYPPDRAWNLLFQAIRTGELTPRWVESHSRCKSDKLQQWECDILHFDFRRYLEDPQSGASLGGILRIGGKSFHPHEIIIPDEEVEHWLASHAEPGVRAPAVEIGIQAGASPIGDAVEAPFRGIEREDWQLTRASVTLIRKAMRDVYQANDRPNVNAVVPLVQILLRQQGKTASKPVIQSVAGEDEFVAKRRKQGQHRRKSAQSDSAETAES
jgi:hypothetical protein